MSSDKWTPLADLMLSQAIARHGFVWISIANQLRKTPQDCKSRYTLLLNAGSVFSPYISPKKKTRDAGKSGKRDVTVEKTTILQKRLPKKTKVGQAMTSPIRKMGAGNADDALSMPCFMASERSDLTTQATAICPRPSVGLQKDSSIL